VTQTDKAGHLAWCALVALGIARQEGAVAAPAQENLFLIRWLATALKQRRFSRDVTRDIEWLLKQGRLHGVRARLPGKLDYLWRSCTGELTEQNDLFRLTCALETAKEMQWHYRLLSDREWSGRTEGLVTLLGSCGWQAETDGETLPRQYRLTAGQEKGQD
jgi:putative hemolysin